MTFSLREKNIIGASVISLTLIAGAFATSGAHPLFTLARANAESTNDLLKAYADKDSDNDGLPDWQESLYGTDPTNPHSVDPSLTDGEAVAKGLVKPKVQSAAAESASSTAENLSENIPGLAPTAGSLTDQFSHEFFQNYMEAGGGQTLSSDQQQVLESQLLTKYGTQAEAKVASSYTSASVRTNPNISATDYANSLGSVFEAHPLTVDDGTVLGAANDLLVNKEDSAQPKLKKFSTVYGDYAAALAAIQVPPALAADHLALMRSFDTISKITKLAPGYETDPVAVLGAFGAYKDSSDAITQAGKDISQAILAEGEPPAGSPAESMVTYARSLETQ